MAIQEWTIVKLVGPAATDAADRFEQWWKARSDHPDSLASNEWSPSIQREASAYLSSLVLHRWGMPIAYFSRHLDLWTSGGGIVGRFPDEPEPQVWHETGQLWCHRLPDGGKLIGSLRPAAERAQFQESEWLAQRLIEAARAYDTTWPEAVLLVNRQAINPTPSDDELKLAAAKLPTWLGPSAAG